MTPSDLEGVAKRVVWFKSPDEALKDVKRVPSSRHDVRVYGYATTSRPRSSFFEQDFVAVLSDPPPGVSDRRSWTYWNKKPTTDENECVGAPKNVLTVWAVAIALLLIGVVTRQSLNAKPQIHSVAHGCAPTGRIDRERFQEVMQTVAEGWNRGNAKLVASCFTENAIYSGPPSPGHRGRKALYEFFGGAKGRELPMHMVWHHLVFDPVQQIGAGEYTFRYRKQTHGLVIVTVSGGLIQNWREYEIDSELPWEKFVGDNKF